MNVSVDEQLEYWRFLSKLHPELLYSLQAHFFNENLLYIAIIIGPFCYVCVSIVCRAFDKICFLLPTHPSSLAHINTADYRQLTLLSLLSCTHVAGSYTIWLIATSSNKAAFFVDKYFIEIEQTKIFRHTRIRTVNTRPPLSSASNGGQNDPITAVDADQKKKENNTRPKRQVLRNSHYLECVVCPLKAIRSLRERHNI